MEVVYIHDKDRRLHRFDLNKFDDVAAYNKILAAKALARLLPKIIRHAKAKRQAAD